VADLPVVMISSTARDLPEHRKAVERACMEQEMFPRMMEHLTATDADTFGIGDDTDSVTTMLARRVVSSLGRIDGGQLSKGRSRRDWTPSLITRGRDGSRLCGSRPATALAGSPTRIARCRKTPRRDSPRHRRLSI